MFEGEHHLNLVATPSRLALCPLTSSPSCPRHPIIMYLSNNRPPPSPPPTTVSPSNPAILLPSLKIPPTPRNISSTLVPSSCILVLSSFFSINPHWSNFPTACQPSKIGSGLYSHPLPPFFQQPAHYDLSRTENDQSSSKKDSETPLSVGSTRDRRCVVSSPSYLLH